MKTGGGIHTLSEEAICDLASQAESLSEFRLEMLRRLSAVVGCEAGLFHDSGATVAINTRCLYQMDASIIRTIQENWHRYTAGLAPVFGALSASRLVVDSQVMNTDALERSDFYEEIMRPNGWDATVYAHVQLSPRHRPAIIALSHGRRRKALDAAQLPRVQRILPLLALADAALVDDAILLDPEERELAQLVSNGYSNREIAGALHLSVFTVRNKLVKLFDRHGIASRAELAHRFGRDLL
jgi:DNA-binding CsgD family transcriptional regulator